MEDQADRPGRTLGPGKVPPGFLDSFKTLSGDPSVHVQCKGCYTRSSGDLSAVQQPLADALVSWFLTILPRGI